MQESGQLMEQPSSSRHGIAEDIYPAPIPQPSQSLHYLPTRVVCTLSQGSNVTSMDFHPSHHTLLLVGSANGEFTLWEIATHDKLLSKPFKVWDMQACSTQYQSVMAKDSSIAVNRVTWSPDGDLIGVAFTKHLIHLHAYQHPNEARQVIEIEAHSGGVNDIAFSRPDKQLYVVTCGDDKLIRVWDMHGQKIYSFEGHEAPVYSICPHHMENIHFIFSISFDGKIKAWLYDNMGSRVEYDAPGKWCTAMLYSADGTRLFSCGTSKEGDSHLVEWKQSEGSIERTYSGFRKTPSSVLHGVVQFDTAHNHILAAGEENRIKFWDADNTNMLTCIEADGGLPSFPRLRFNKEGNLLAVTTVENGFKILANTDGLRSLLAFGVGHVATMSETRDQARKVRSILPEESTPCIAVSTNDSDVMAACGGKVSKVLDDDDLLREIIVRVGFSTTLVRAALVCKRWYHHASEPAFLYHFHERHRSRLLGFYLEYKEGHKVASIRFFPMLPQPPELAAVIRRVVSYSLESYRGAPAKFLCSWSSRVLISLHNQNNHNKFTVGVHNLLYPERGLVVVPPCPHVQIQDVFYRNLLPVDEVDGLSYLHVSVVSNIQITTSTVHVHILRHDDGVWRMYHTFDIDQLLDLRQEPKAVLANNKIYIASAQKDIVVLDLNASSISTVQLPQGVEYGDRDIMLARADDASGVYVIHVKKIQLHIWLHKGDNWLLVDTICLRDKVVNLRIPGCEVEDEHNAPLQIHHVGDYAEFVFLEMGRCALHLDVKSMQLRKVYDMTEEELQLGDIHPLMMIWPPKFPVLKDNPASNAM
ncbi:Topless-related protein 2 [Hordeum vulgare]|nr:Topless-related protein 2 [Hordeum vulgare]